MNTKEKNMPFPQCTPGLTLRKSKAHGSLERFFEINNWIGQRWGHPYPVPHNMPLVVAEGSLQPEADLRRGPAGLIEWLEF